MQPDLILIPFGENATPGTIDPIPETRGPGDDPQQATWDEGFPLVTMTPLAAGGIPPKGQDFNGVLNAISEHTVFTGRGGQYKWSSAYVAASGGYAIGDVIQADDGLNSYVSLVNTNTANFNTTPASIGVSWALYSGRKTQTQATETVSGIAEIATQAEVTAGADDTRVITPLKLAVRLAAGSAIVGSARNVKMSLAVASASATLTAKEVVVKSSLGGSAWLLPSVNKTINLAATGAGGMDAGTAPISGFVALYAIYNPIAGTSALLAVNATAAAAPEIYGGASMPAGYTASALLSVWPTNASGQFAIGIQVGREIGIATNTVFTTTTTQASLTSFSIAAVAPRNAVTCRCDTTVGSSAAGAGANAVICGTPFEVGRVAQGATSPTAGATSVSSFPHIPILNEQTLYYRGSVSGGTFTFVVSISSYTI